VPLERRTSHNAQHVDLYRLSRRLRPQRTNFPLTIETSAIGGWLVRVGRPGRAARPVQRSALDQCRSGWKPVFGGSLQRSRAEIPAETRSGSPEVSGPEHRYSASATN